MNEKFRKYPEWFIEELDKLDDKKKAKDGSLKSDDKVDFICKDCGNHYTQRVASHIALSTGRVYSKLGFTCSGDTRFPRYYWYLNGSELKREQCQLKFLSKQYPELYQESLNRTGNKEDYIMLSLGAMKVYRSGHTKWIKRYS
jgi:hypothetical protein